MLRTIQIGSCHHVQGTLVKHLPNGRARVRVGQDFFTGVLLGA